MRILSCMRVKHLPTYAACQLTYMDSTQVMHQLRQLAAIKGLDNQARPYKWLKLSGVSEAAAIASDDYDAAACGHHKDSSTVHCDVERSLWGIPCEESRAKARQELKRLLNAVVVISQGNDPRSLYLLQ